MCAYGLTILTILQHSVGVELPYTVLVDGTTVADCTRHTYVLQVLYGDYRDFVVTPIFGAVDYAAAFNQPAVNNDTLDAVGAEHMHACTHRNLRGHGQQLE
jgi:hypothetical protein